MARLLPPRIGSPWLGLANQFGINIGQVSEPLNAASLAALVPSGAVLLPALDAAGQAPLRRAAELAAATLTLLACLLACKSCDNANNNNLLKFSPPELGRRTI